MSDAPDRFALGVRFGCGAIFGFVVPFAGGSIVSFETGRSAPGWALAAAVVCGLFAARFGEVFWEKVAHSRLFRWWM